MINGNNGRNGKMNRNFENNNTKRDPKIMFMFMTYNGRDIRKVEEYHVAVMRFFFSFFVFRFISGISTYHTHFE